MGTDVSLVAMATLVCSALLTELIRRFALSRGVLDVPNARSSHTVPTPRGGGTAIVVAASVGLAVLAFLSRVHTDLLLAMLGGGFAVAAIGFADDRKPQSPTIRLLVHFAAALWALLCLGGLPPLRFGEHVVHLSWIGHGLALFGIVWTINLFNFMDGIDGIAASETVFMAGAAALLLSPSSQSSDVSAAGWVLAAAAGGFLLRNWPPAKIFMGDVGSGYLGYVVAVLGLAAARENSVVPWIWLILGGVFFVDATVTLLRRTARHERVYEAHRSHAYQWLARRWGSHGRVTVLVIAVNALWLLPSAYLATRNPPWASWIAAGALLPVIIGVAAAGAGQREFP